MSGRRKKKPKPLKFDGLNEIDLKRIGQALRKAWGWSYSRKLVIDRCLIAGGFSRCERCKKKVPRIFVDHIKPCGSIDVDIIKRMFIPSKDLMGLCSICHSVKTRADRQAMKKFCDRF